LFLNYNTYFHLFIIVIFLISSQIQEIKKLENENKKGGILPLAASLPLIFGGLTAAKATAGGVATVVQKVK